MFLYLKNMEFNLRVGDMSFFVFCKLEIVIFKIVQVMTENIPFAFLYVLSIHSIINIFIKCLGLGDSIVCLISVNKISDAVRKNV